MKVYRSTYEDCVSLLTTSKFDDCVNEEVEDKSISYDVNELDSAKMLPPVETFADMRFIKSQTPYYEKQSPLVIMTKNDEEFYIRPSNENIWVHVDRNKQ